MLMLCKIRFLFDLRENYVWVVSCIINGLMNIDVINILFARVLYYDALSSLINKLVRCIFCGMEVMSRLSSKCVLGLFLVAAVVARV